MTGILDVKNVMADVIFAPNALLAPGGNGTVEQTQIHIKGVEKVQLTLTAVKVSITDALAYGSALLGYLPNTNYLFLGGEANFTWAKDGTGIVTGENPKVAVGTAAASNATLSSTMINLINGGSGGSSLGTGLTGTVKMHSNDNVTAVPYVGIANSATTGIYLNGAVNPTGDGYVTISGTLSMYFLDLGNETG